MLDRLHSIRSDMLADVLTACWKHAHLCEIAPSALNWAEHTNSVSLWLYGRRLAAEEQTRALTIPAVPLYIYRNSPESITCLDADSVCQNALHAQRQLS